MNIEPGKFYRTRGGSKVRIYSTDGEGFNAIHGAYWSVGFGGLWTPCAWNNSGQWCNGNSSGLDIISEWVDKPEVNWSAMPAWAQFIAATSNLSYWMWFSHMPIKINDGWVSLDCGRWGSIPQPFHPSFSGDWKDSLAERPKA